MLVKLTGPNGPELFIVAPPRDGQAGVFVRVAATNPEGGSFIWLADGLRYAVAESVDQVHDTMIAAASKRPVPRPPIAAKGV